MKVYRILPGDPDVTVEWKDDALGVDWTPITETKNAYMSSEPKAFTSRRAAKTFILEALDRAKVVADNRDGGVEYYP
jgi:hypothetical protein